MKFKAIAVGLGGTEGDVESLYALGEDGQVYCRVTRRTSKQGEPPKYAEYWSLLNLPIETQDEMGDHVRVSDVIEAGEHLLSLIEMAQKKLAEYVVPGGRISDNDLANIMLGIFDSKAQQLAQSQWETVKSQALSPAAQTLSPVQDAKREDNWDKTEFESWWNSTNNSNFFSIRPISVEQLKETAMFSWRAARLLRKD